MKKGVSYITEERHEKLEKARTSMMNMLKAIDLIEGGMSETAACRQLNISRSAFRHIVSSRKLGWEDNEERQDAVRVLRSPAERIYLDMTRERSLDHVHPDIDSLMEILIELKLNDQEKNFIRKYYYEGLTMQRTGDACGVSKQRVCDVIKSALKHLKDKGAGTDFLRYGKEYYERSMELRRIRVEKSSSAKIRDIEKEIRKTRKECAVSAR